LALVGGLLLAAAFLLIGWNKVAASPRLCATCHEMDSSVVSAARSVHADVPCLACHTRPGLAGALRYLPTFAREGVATLAGWDGPHGVLRAAACDRCHDDLGASPAGAAAHSGSAVCSSCHGDVAHPADPLVRRTVPRDGQAPHPTGYLQTHGEDATAEPASCTQCHQSGFCQACHLKSSFPHPDDWISAHGAVQETGGPQACTLCHPTTFCAGCHGTDIPHDADWLGQHYRALQDASASPCLVCHPRADCATCHAEHGVHRQQDLYREPT
jgi:predicted CXXCH cytochrome family protein